MDLALFDFDGTITTGDTFTPFLRYAISRRRLVVGGLALTPVLAAHRLGVISSPKARPIVSRVGFQGASAIAVKALGNRYASEVLPAVVRQQAMDRIGWHKERGDTVVVVSAGLDVYLRPWSDAHAVVLICTELEEHSGRLTGRYRHADCSGRRKAELIQTTIELSRFTTIYAYGDTIEDREMLALASRRYYRWRELNEGERPNGADMRPPR